MTAKWRPGGTVPMVQVDRNCINSDQNRYMAAGTHGFLTDLSLPIWLKSNGDWVDDTGATTTPTIMSQTATIVADIVARGFAAPTGADLNKLDRAVYRMVKGGIFSKGVMMHCLRWNSVAADAVNWAGHNIFADNVCDKTGHPYHFTVPPTHWTAGRGLLGDGATLRWATTFNPSAAASGAWTDPSEGTVTAGVFQAFVAASCYDHGLTSPPKNGFELVSDNGKAGIRCRSQSGAASTMNSNANADFSVNASGDPHMMGALRNGTTAADHYNIDNGAVDSIGSDTANYATDYAASVGKPDTFYYSGGKTNGGLLSYCDRTTGFGAIFKPLTLAEIALFADIEREWGTSDGFYA